MAEDNPRLQARLTGDMPEWLDGRAKRMHTGSRNQQAVIEITTWRTVLNIELHRIRLTLAQASCIADVLNSTAMDTVMASSLGVVYAACYDAFRLAREAGGEISSYGAKHGPDFAGDAAQWEQDLLDYLGGLNVTADHALRDAIARWWALPDDPELTDAARFAMVGLRVTP